jgi:ABC-type phosphate transport system substrate-binding protein
LSVRLAAVTTALGATVLAVGTALPAQAAQAARADYQPGPNDIVGVGSDTLQYLTNFANDGDPEGDPGFNATNTWKVVSMDATADSNARLSYNNNSTTGSPSQQNPTDVLRAQTYPVQRVNGSGAGLSALAANQGTTGNSGLPTINFVRMSSTPSVAQGGQFASGLEVVKIATENLGIAKDSVASNDTVALSAKQLATIYQANIAPSGCPTWGSVGVTGAAANNWIAPVIPQAGSGTRNTFLADLAAAAGVSSITLGTCVVTAEENDPTSITGYTTPAGWGGPVGAGVADSQDAIAPMSGSRINLWSGTSGNPTLAPSSGVGYFRSPNVAYGGTNAPLVPNVVQVITGTASDGTAAYVDNRPLNIVYPFNQNSSTTAGEPGSPYNWANLLFCPSTKAGAPTPWYATPAGQVAIAEAGAVPSYSCATTPLT